MKNLYLLENIGKSEITNIAKDEHAHVITFDYESHKLLLIHNIKHQTVDDFLTDDERARIFQFCFSLWQWHDKLDVLDLKFHNVNLLSIIDRNEIHEALMNIVPKIHVVKKAIEKIKPSLIFASTDIHNLFSNSENKINLIQSSSYLDNYFTHDNINISYELGSFNLGIKLSRKKYEFVKRNLEKIICSMYGLRKKDPAKKKIILIEFNPEVFFDLLNEIDRQEFQPILVNFRRPAIWSKNSIIQLKKSHSLVGILEDWISKEELSQIKKYRNIYLKKIQDVFLKERVLSEIFVFEGIRFDQQMKTSFLKVLDDRLEEYFFGIYLAESMNKLDDVIGVITLNLSGETEKIFSTISSKIPIVVLQHAFSNYVQEISYLDALDDFHLIKDRIAVWGNIVKDYLVENKHLSQDRIIVSGNPKYDSFVSLEKKKNTKKIILVTPRPIINHVEGIRIELYERYEKIIDDMLEIVDDRDDIEIIFKLHPQQSKHNKIIREYIENKNRNVKIMQFKSINELLTICDLHVNIAPDNFDASTVILEAMILGRPTINIQLQTTKIEFEFMKDNAIKTINYDSNIKKEVFEILFDDKKSEELIKKSKIYLKRYIANHGKASQSLIVSIKNIKT